MGKFLGRSSNKMEVFIAVIILPVAKRNEVKWTARDSNKPDYVRVTGVKLDIIGKVSIWVVFNNLKGAKELKVYQHLRPHDGENYTLSRDLI